jgi:hypothetical protein
MKNEFEGFDADLDALLMSEWDFCETDQDIIDRYGQETYELAKKAAEAQSKRQDLKEARSKTLWGRFQNWRTSRKELKAAVDFIMHGPGGD